MNKDYYIGTEKTERITLEYYVCGDRAVNELSGYFEWGIKIIKKEKKVEEIIVRNISPEFNKACEIAEILMKNSVTPIGVYDALNNIL